MATSKEIRAFQQRNFETAEQPGGVPHPSVGQWQQWVQFELAAQLADINDTLVGIRSALQQLGQYASRIR